MSRRICKTVGITAGSLAAAVLVLILVVPLFITVDPYAGVTLTEAAAGSRGQSVTVPFAGTDGIDLFVTEQLPENGGDLTLLLLHGSNYNAATWEPVSDGLARYGRVIAYDQIPYGLSEKMVRRDWTGENPYTVEASLKQMRSLLEQMDARRVVLVGSSYGGTLAVRAALEYPELIEGLILVDAAVFVSETMPAFILNSRQMNNLGPLMARSLGTSGAFYEKCYADPRGFEETRKRKTMMMTEVTGWDAAYWEYLKAWGSADTGFQASIPGISVPTLVIHGEEDRIVPLGDSRRLAEMIPGSTLSVIEGVGHLPHEESPDEFLRVVDSWMRSPGL